MELFIDTNVLLSFYDYSGDDLEELRKLVVLMQKGKVKLWLPQQVVDEFSRNRGNKIAEVLRRFKEQKLGNQFPQIAKDYAEYEELRELQQKYSASHTKLLNTIEADIENMSLKADKVTGELMSLGKQIMLSAQLVDHAKLRSAVGNPPGKSGSLGDAINWESLIESVPDGANLYFISGDKDYASVLDGDKFDSFLTREWATRKHSDLIYYKRLSAFLKDQFPEIKLAAELEKELLVQELSASGSFKQTHAAIAKLAEYKDFTPSQRNAIIQAAAKNSQVALILDDDDVKDFLEGVLHGHEDEVDNENLELLGLFASWYQYKFPEQC